MLLTPQPLNAEPCCTLPRQWGNTAVLFNSFVTAMQWQGDIRISEGTMAAGLVFGAASCEELGDRWYAVHLQPDRNNTVRVFCEGGDAPLDSGGLPVPVGTFDGAVHVRVSIDTDNYLRVYVGQEDYPIFHAHLPHYRGGYVGVMTFDTAARFENLRLESGASAHLTVRPLERIPTGRPAEGTGAVCEGDGVYTLPRNDVRSTSLNDHTIGLFDAYSEDFVYEATVTPTDGAAAGLLFGATSTDCFVPYGGFADPCGGGEQWTGVLVHTDTGAVTVVQSKASRDEVIGSTVLPHPITGAFRLKLQMRGNTLCVFVHDMDTPVYRYILAGYEGGYVGLLSHNTAARFEQVAFYGMPADCFAAPQTVSLQGGALRETALPARYEYTADATDNTLRLTVHTRSGRKERIYPILCGKNIVRMRLEDEGCRPRTLRITVYRAYDYTAPYREPFRPQLRFSPPEYWCNDPNGMVYSDGVYHMYYQHNPGVLFHDGRSHWGHAVSTDMLHWTQLPTALYIDEIGIIGSGSGVIDRDNVSGLFDDSVPPERRMVSFFTYFARGAHPGDGGDQRQAIAYSVDGGLTLQKHDVVIPNTDNAYDYDFRDPKVIYMPQHGEWLMAVAGGRARIFTSHDLIHWTHNNDLSYADGTPMYSECPDLFPLPVDGDPDNIKWVYSGCGRYYVVGQLVKEAGKYRFVGESNWLPLYSDSEFYATQSFSDTPDGRRIFISWIGEHTSTQLAAYEKPWNGSFSLPMEAKLVTVNGKLRLTTYPIAEVNTLRRRKLFETADVTVAPDSAPLLEGVRGTLLDIEATVRIVDAAAFGWHLRADDSSYTAVSYTAETGMLTMDKRYSGVLPTGVRSMKVESAGERLHLRIIVDTSVIEVCANGGLTAFGTVFFPHMDAQAVRFYTEGGAVTVEHMAIYEMASVWEGASATEPKPLLCGLAVSNGELSPAFYPLTEQYTAVCGEGATLTVRYPHGSQVLCTVDGKPVVNGGQVPLSAGQTVRLHLTDGVWSRDYTVAAK